MDFFFQPKGVAVVGATPQANTGGYHLLTNLTLSYHGSIYPVNPNYSEILGLECFPRVSDIKGPLDLALILVPAKTVPGVLEDCIAKDVRGAILESGGFAEVGPDGRILQDECLSIARKGRLRLWGPNCMGLIDASTGYVFSFIAPEAWQGLLNSGGISLIVQSGLLAGGFVTALMDTRTIGLAKACSIGNKADVDETELLEYLLRDPYTKVIGLYLESFSRGRHFLELVESSVKPIVVLKGGKSSLGAEASLSHTGSLAGNDRLIRNVLKQAGVCQADDLFEMVDIARALEKDFCVQRPLGGKARIAVLSYSGAAGIITADQMEENGLTLARLSSQTQQHLEEFSPTWVSVKNPVDYWPAMEKSGPLSAYKHAIEVLHNALEVDGLIVHLFAGLSTWGLDMKEMMSGINVPTKPILFWLIGQKKGLENNRMELEEEGWPTFHEIQRTVKVMTSLFEHSGRRKKSLRHCLSEFPIPPSLKQLVSFAEAGKRFVLDEYDSKKWLQALNLNVVKEILVRNIEEGIKAAEELGYPVVLKGRVEGRIHKSEAGLVKLNLLTPDQLVSAYQRMLGSNPTLQSFLVQPMLKGDLELIAGVTRDSQFGPAVMLGLGGTQAEVYKDVVFRLIPLDETEISEMVSELIGEPLLRGFRGSKPVDLKSLGDWLVKLGWLAKTFEGIEEIDINPLLIVDGQPVAIDATIIFRQT